MLESTRYEKTQDIRYIICSTRGDSDEWTIFPVHTLVVKGWFLAGARTA
jgi:hypothetical protein